MERQNAGRRNKTCILKKPFGCLRYKFDIIKTNQINSLFVT